MPLRFRCVKEVILKITLNRAELLCAAKRGESIAPHNSPLDVLRGLLLELDAANGTLTMTASNLEVTLEQKIPCTVPEDDALVVNARLTVDMLSRLPGDTVELERIPGKPVLYLRGGMAEYRVPIWERSSYPKLEIPFPEDTVRVSGIPGMAKRTVFAAAEDNNKPLLKCVNLKFTKEGLRAAVGNGNCIITVRGDEKSTGDISLLLPAPSLEKLAQLCGDKDEFRVGTTGKAIVFLRENFAYSACLLGGEYIDTDRLMDGIRNQFQVLTGISELRNALSSAVCVDREGKVCLRFEGGRLTFHCSGEHGNTNVSMETIPLTGMPQGEYWYSSSQLTACLKALSGTVKLGIAQGGMLTLETENACYVQTAMRPPAADRKEAQAKTPVEQAA